MTALSFENLSFDHGHGPLFEGLSLEIPSSRLTTVVGPNGAGKTTMLELLAGLRQPKSGQVSLYDRPISGMSMAEMARSRSYLPGPSSRDLPFTAGEVIAMGSFPWFGHDVRAERETGELMSVLDLDHLAERPMSSLSSGEARRVEIARVLTQSTETLLLDEPLASLDLRHAEAVMRLLGDEARAGATVVAVVHDLNAARRHADHAILLPPGGRAHVGTPEEVFTSDLLSHAYSMPIEVSVHGARSTITPGSPNGIDYTSD